MRQLTALLLVAVMFCAFAAPSLQTALLPDAEIIACCDKSFNETPFVKALTEQFLNNVKEMCKDNQAILDKIRAAQEESKCNHSALFSAKMSSAISEDNDDEFYSDKLEIAIAFEADKPLTELIEKKFAEEAANPNSDTILSKTEFKDGWLAYELSPKKEPDFKLIATVTPDGKMLFIGKRATLLRQLDNPPELTPAVKEYYTSGRLTGPVLSVAFLLPEKMRQLMVKKTMKNAEDGNPSPALPFIQSINGVEFAVKAEEQALDLQIDANFNSAEMPMMVKGMLDAQVIPMLPILGPTVLNGKNIPMLTSVQSYANGTHVGLKCPMTQTDIDAFVEMAKKQAERIKQAAAQGLEEAEEEEAVTPAA